MLFNDSGDGVFGKAGFPLVLLRLQGVILFPLPLISHAGRPGDLPADEHIPDLLPVPPPCGSRAVHQPL